MNDPMATVPGRARDDVANYRSLEASLLAYEWAACYVHSDVAKEIAARIEWRVWDCTRVDPSFLEDRNHLERCVIFATRHAVRRYARRLANMRDESEDAATDEGDE